MSGRLAKRELTSAYQRTGSISGVASEFGVAYETARQWLLAAGVTLQAPHRPSPGAGQLDVAEVAERYRQGESLAAIAATLSVSPNTIRNRLRAAGVDLRPRPGWDR